MDKAPDLKRRSFLFGRFAEASEPAGPSLAIIGQSCFAFQGIACMSCRDACLTGAIRFELAPGGASPRILTDSCTGCGDCTQACPADAIGLEQSGEAA